MEKQDFPSCVNECSTHCSCRRVPSPTCGCDQTGSRGRAAPGMNRSGFSATRCAREPQWRASPLYALMGSAIHVAPSAASGFLVREASDDQDRRERELEPKTPGSPDPGVGRSWRSRLHLEVVGPRPCTITEFLGPCRECHQGSQTRWWQGGDGLWHLGERATGPHRHLRPSVETPRGRLLLDDKRYHRPLSPAAYPAPTSGKARCQSRW